MRSYRDTLLNIFPPPRFLSMPSVGIDISDNSLKFIELEETRDGLRVGRYGEEKVPPGIVVAGKIQKPDALTDILRTVGNKHSMHFVRATLPEERGYLFELSLPVGMSPDEMTSAIEFRLEENVPLAPDEAVFGYDLLPRTAKDEKGMRRGVVSVFPRVAAEAYTKIFYNAGIVPLSLETEPQAITRAVVPNGDTGTYLIVDFGRQRSGISIASGGAVQFATTTDVGGDPLTEAFRTYYADVADEEIVTIKNTQGLRAVREENDPTLTREVTTVIESLLGHIQEHLRYWNTHSQGEKERRSAAVSKVLLCGGNANLAGLPERLSQELKLPVARANVWVNTFSLEKHIPAGISFEESLGYAPAIGLALHGVHPVMRNRHMANLLPREELTTVRRERRNRIVVVSLTALLVTIILGGIFLIPSLILSRTKALSAERKIELTQSFITQREESGVLSDVRAIQSKIVRLEGLLSQHTVSEILAALDESTPPGIVLLSVGYERNPDAPDDLTIKGTAATRDTLLTFSRRLEREDLFRDVDLPVSNLAASTNIAFSLTVAVPKPEQPVPIEESVSSEPS